MQLFSINKTILSIVSITSVISSMAMAQLVPGPSHGNNGGNPPPRYNPCDVPTDPNCHNGGGNHNGGGYPHEQPGHGNYPYPNNPGNGNSYPNNPYPNYPSNDFGRLTIQAINGQLGNCTVETNVSGNYNESYNQIYVSGRFYSNYNDGSNGYSENNRMESALQSLVNNGRCGNTGGYNPYPSNPGQSSHIFRSVYLSRSVYNQSIDLKTLAGLDSRYAGYRIVSVSAKTTPTDQFRTVAQLVVDGRIFASQVNPGHEINLVPQQSVMLSRYGNRVELAITGGTYIEEIRIELSRY